MGEPGVEGGDGVGLGVPTVGDADELAAGLGVGLGLADADEQAFGLGLDVGELKARELRAAQRRGESEQDDGGVPGSAGRRAVDVGEHAADVVGAQGSGLAARCGAQGPAQTAPDGLDRLVGDRVHLALGLVGGGDRGAGALDGASGDALGGEVGEVGADSDR